MENKVKRTSKATSKTATLKTFEQIKADFEKAYQSGGDYASELMTLAKVISLSVLATVIDPQRHTATKQARVSNSGQQKNLIQIKSDILFQFNNFSMAEQLSKGTQGYYTASGDYETKTDKETSEAIKQALKPFGDGMDLYNETACVILEYMAKQDRNTASLDHKWNEEQLSKKVYIQDYTSKATKMVECVAIVEIYRAIRRYIEQSRAIKDTSIYGYDIINEDSAELNRLYFRAGKYSTINDERGASLEQFKTIEELERKIDLTPRQKIILDLRLQGYGYKAICTKLGISVSSLRTHLKRVQENCIAIGFTPNK